MALAPTLLLSTPDAVSRILFKSRKSRNTGRHGLYLNRLPTHAMASEQRISKRRQPIPNVKFRSASDDDMPLVKGMIWSEKMIPIDLPKERFVIADGGSEIGLVGAGQVKEWGGNPPLREVRSMIVKREFRGGGVGSKILQELLSNQEGNILHLVTIRRRMKFYARAGFKEVLGEDVPRQLRLEIFIGNFIANRMYRDSCVCMRVEL